MDKHEALKKYFGHDDFRSGQEQIIDRILGGCDCLGVMPTGAGKSMCYQIPALLMEGTTLVISPLISLMKDQVEALRQSGVPAAYINSTLTPHEYYETLDSVSSGNCKLLYVAPERLPAGEFISLCGSIKIPLIAVDESHCVSQWGQDFRPSYVRIAEFVESLPVRPVVAAFTATATDAVKRDIVDILRLREPFMMTTGFDRENLYFEVRSRKATGKDGELLSILRESGKRSAIVYCSTRKTVEAVGAFLKLNGISAAIYHAGMSPEQRAAAQEDFIYDRVNVIVATNAFGMGIDKSDVSLVVHYNMPKDIESYYQESGRAGRDGSPARCILLYSGKDVHTNKYLIEHGKEDAGLTEEQRELLKERDEERLRQMTFYSTTTRCLRAFMLRYFGEHTGSFCGNCGSCNCDYDTVDVTVSAQKILSCIFRMKQRGIPASAERVTSVLRGEETSAECAALSTCGIMRGTASEEIAAITAHLTELGYIEGDPLTLTESADEFIKSRRTLLMKRPKPVQAESGFDAAPSRTSSAPQSLPADIADREELYEQLRELRSHTARTLGTPAYAVFSDVTLRDMCRRLPLTTSDFMQVSGIGSIKAERFSKSFGDVIRRYMQEHGIERPTAAAPAKQSLTPQHEELFERLRELRRSIAAENNVPAYIIFRDDTLSDMSRKLPVTEEDFLSIRGVGAAKCDMFGSRFIKLIRDYCREKKL